MKFLEYLSSIKGKRVFVVGAGISNSPLIEALLDAGVDVTVCDKRLREELGEASGRFERAGARLQLGDGYLEKLDADIIFRTPGLMPWNPSLQAAVANGAALSSEMEAFFDVCPCKIIGVTGSDGKTTTTSIIGELLRNAGKTVHVGGNIGAPLLCNADSMSSDDIVVLELSSFQLISMRKSPHIAVVTNISPNHLDVHRDMDEYVDAKRNIFAHQKSTDKAVFNLDNAYTRKYQKTAPGETAFFSSSGYPEDGVFLSDGTIFDVRGGQRAAIMEARDILLPGLHNVENFMAAFAALQGLVSNDVMRETARNFRSVPHRIEFVREFEGVRYYNDSIASSPTRTIAGLLSFDKKVILIAGGKRKGVAFDELGKMIVKRVKSLILTGMTAEEIHNAVVSSPEFDGEPEIQIHSEFKDAVEAASRLAKEGDSVLLSPACTSFDMFRNFEERGDTFKGLVLGLGNG